MCGITALWAPKARVDLAASIRAATDAIVTRGPDDQGIWIDTEVGIALGHRRLAVIDLTQAGHQPMLSRDGRFCLTFNGEIYNFKDLRAELEAAGNDFIGQSDTEVMLAAFVRWGIEKSLSKFIGMFAFALWDRRDRKLILCRDRFGKKPLYFGWIGAGFAVASQLKALRAIPGFRADINRTAFSQYAAKGYVPSPLSIYDGIYKLNPASLLELDMATVMSAGQLCDWMPKSRHYWDVETVVSRSVQHRYQGSEEAAGSDLLELLNDAVRMRMISDVPIGAFLSGGMDSSLIVALMQRNSGKRVKTFTIGFANGQYDESAAAASLAQSIGTDHTSIRLSPLDCQTSVPSLPEVFDEPFADPSAIPTLLVSEYARKQVTVALSGDGGDELFGGYNRHVWLPQIWHRTAWMPRSVRSAIGGIVGELPPSALWGTMRLLSAGSAKHEAPRLPEDKLGKIAKVLGAANFRDAYEKLTNVARVSRYSILADKNLNAENPATRREVPDNLSEPELLMYLDMTTYLVDDVLVKVDRATMAHSLEARAPFLDHRVAEFAWSLPSDMKTKGTVGKRILRRLRAELIPSQTTERPKMGFAVPIGEWLRGPLRGWADDLLNPAGIRSDGFFDADVVSSKWRSHVKRHASHEYELWGVLMYNAWLRTNYSH